MRRFTDIYIGNIEDTWNNSHSYGLFCMDKIVC